MGNKRKKILIFGAGPAGLAAGVRLMEKGGRDNLDVTIVNLDNMLGGKAKSWQDPVFNDGRFYDHGIHFVFGFYTHLRGLMAKAGINDKNILVPNNGRFHWYEMRSKKIHTIRMSRFSPMSMFNAAFYDGWSLSEKINFIKWGTRNLPDIFLKKDISDLDEICFTAWAAETGMDYNFVRTSTFFRFTQDALFNWPYEISAYVNLVGMRKILNFNRNVFGAFSYEKCRYYIVNDGWSSQIWNPIGEYYKKLGGKFDFGRKLVGLKHNGQRITGVEVGQSTFSGQSPIISIAPGSKELISDFDYVISAIPMNNFRELNPDDKGMWNKWYFNSMHNLTGVVPISIFAFLKEDIRYKYKTHVNGIKPPLFNAVDYKHISLPYKNNNQFGSVIHMQGQETGFENLSDKELVQLGLGNLAQIKGFERLRDATLKNYFVYRGNKNHSRFLLTDPGTYKFRPEIKSPFKNLYLAGDWVRHDDSSVVPCMDGAINSGTQAAEYVLTACGLGKGKNA